MSLARLKQKLKRHPVLGRAKRWAWIAPGNVPDPIVLAVVSARLRGAELILKLSRRNEKIGRALVRRHARKGQKVRIVVGYQEFRKHAASADAWVVYGSDATLAAMKKLKPAGAGWVGHGHRISMTVLFESAIGSRLVRACACDIRAYDQQGCLSPQIIWVQGEAAARFALALQSELTLLEKKSPTRRDPESARLRRAVLDELRVRSLDPQDLVILGVPSKTQYSSAAFDGAKKPVVYRLLKGAFLTPAVGQVVGVKSFRSIREVRAGMTSFARHLQGIGYAGRPAECSAVRRAFADTTAVYFAPVGRLQQPPIDWQF